MTATFQRYVDMVLAGLKWTSLLVYLDDVCIFSKTLADHLQRLEITFIRFRTYKLKLNAAECHILQRQFLYLGHAINEAGINPDPKKVEAILKMPSPRNIRQLRSFLGFSIIIVNLSKIIACNVNRYTLYLQLSIGLIMPKQHFKF